MLDVPLELAMGARQRSQCMQRSLDDRGRPAYHRRPWLRGATRERRWQINREAMLVNA